MAATPDRKDGEEQSTAPAAESAAAADAKPVAPEADDGARPQMTSGLDVFDGLPAKRRARASTPPPASGPASRRPPPPPTGLAAALVPAAPTSSGTSSAAPPPPSKALPPPSSGAGPASRAPAPPSSGSGPTSKAPPPPPSVSRPPPAPPAIAPDWDDDEEDTATLAKQGLRDSGGLHTAPPPVAAVRPSVPPPSIPPPSVVPASHSGPVPSLPPPPAKTSGGVIAIGALVIVGLVALIVYLVMPRDGALVITVAGPDQQAVAKVDVFVDGQKRCEASPCRVEGLSAGTHIVTAIAVGFRSTAPQAVSVRGGSESVTNLALGAATAGTGVRVTAGGAKGLRLSVDGADKGELPATAADLSPGEHTIRVAGNDAFEPHEQRITVRADEVQTLDLSLKVVRGAARVKAGRNADGAEVYLVSGSEKRRLDRLPMTVGIKTDKPYELLATKKGFQDFKRAVTFDANEAEKTLVIDMVAVGAPPEVAPGPAPKPGEKAPPEKPAPVADEQGTININSLPSSNVILNGRPLGPTPKMGVKVKAGPVTVVFVHPEHGRKVQSTVVKPGGTATVLVRFP